MPNRTRRDKRRSNNDNVVFTSGLSLIKAYADYDTCIENFISRFGPNDVIPYNENIGFALK